MFCAVAASNVQPPRVTNAKGAGVTPPEKLCVAVWVDVRGAPVQSCDPLKDPRLHVHHPRALKLQLDERLSRRNAALQVPRGDPAPRSFRPSRGQDVSTRRRSVPPSPSQAQALASAALLGGNAVRALQGEACRS